MSSDTAKTVWIAAGLIVTTLAMLILQKARRQRSAKAKDLMLRDKLAAEFGIEESRPLAALIDGSKTHKEIYEELIEQQGKLETRFLAEIGQNLLREGLDEAVGLIRFLRETGSETQTKEPTTPEDFGLLYFKCLNYARENPDSELARTFYPLNDAWKTGLAKKEH